MKYIAYGSNMVAEQMAHRCPQARLIGTGFIPKARLEFYLHATVERSKIKTDRVPVAVWEISKADEKSLDRYEGFPNYYTKDVWTVQMDGGSRIKGMIYLMNLKRKSSPTRDYYLGIRNAYDELGFSTEIRRVLLPALRRSVVE